jgi:hypothetical protein
VTHNHKQQNQQGHDGQADYPLTLGFHNSNSIRVVLLLEYR